MPPSFFFAEASPWARRHEVLRQTKSGLEGKQLPPARRLLQPLIALPLNSRRDRVLKLDPLPRPRLHLAEIGAGSVFLFLQKSMISQTILLSLTRDRF